MADVTNVNAQRSTENARADELSNFLHKVLQLDHEPALESIIKQILAINPSKPVASALVANNTVLQMISNNPELELALLSIDAKRRHQLDTENCKENKTSVQLWQLAFVELKSLARNNITLQTELEQFLNTGMHQLLAAVEIVRIMRTNKHNSSLDVVRSQTNCDWIVPFFAAVSELCIAVHRLLQQETLSSTQQALDVLRCINAKAKQCLTTMLSWKSAVDSNQKQTNETAQDTSELFQLLTGPKPTLGASRSKSPPRVRTRNFGKSLPITVTTAENSDSSDDDDDNNANDTTGNSGDINFLLNNLQDINSAEKTLEGISAAYAQTSTWLTFTDIVMLLVNLVFFSIDKIYAEVSQSFWYIKYQLVGEYILGITQAITPELVGNVIEFFYRGITTPLIGGRYTIGLGVDSMHAPSWFKLLEALTGAAAIQTSNLAVYVTVSTATFIFGNLQFIISAAYFIWKLYTLYRANKAHVDKYIRKTTPLLVDETLSVLEKTKTIVKQQQTRLSDYLRKQRESARINTTKFANNVDDDDDDVLTVINDVSNDNLLTEQELQQSLARKKPTETPNMGVVIERYEDTRRRRYGRLPITTK